LGTLEPALGRLEIGGTGKMSLRVVSRATARPDDAAALEAGDTCSASAAGIVCTAGAIASILGQGPGAKPPELHPVLLFLIAHELGHIRHGDVGRFAMPPLRIKARSTSAAIVANIRSSACAEHKTDEDLADDFARGVIGRAIAAGAFSQHGSDLGLTTVWVLNTMFEHAAQAAPGGDRSTASLLDSTNVATKDELAVLVRRVLCLIAPGQARDVLWQGFPGGYDTEGVRVTRAAERLDDELAHGAYGIAAGAGNLPELLRSLVGIRRAMMRENAALVTGVAAGVCRQITTRADPWELLGCASLTREVRDQPAAPRACPALEALAAGPPTTTPAASADAPTMITRDNELHLNEPVTAVSIRDTGDTIAAVGDRGRIVVWRAQGMGAMIGEAGCRVGGIAAIGDSVIGVCSRGEAIVRFEAGQRTTTPLSALRVGGEADTPERIDVSWVGAVAGHVVAAVSQLGSGEGRLVEVTSDGLRSVPAWTDAGCDTRMFSVRVAVVDKTLWAVPAQTTMTPQLLGLSVGLDRVVSHLQPDNARVDGAIKGHPRGELPIISCHASAARHAPLCVAMDGALVEARKPLGPILARIVPVPSWELRAATVRSCGTSRADYLMVAERDRVRVFDLPARGGQATQIWWRTLEVDRADLVCGATGATVAINAMGASTVVTLGGAP
jgi:hypothetical protein